MCMTQQMGEKPVKRDYKSRMFTMIFKEKKELLQLYNAVGQRNYEDPELLTINTLDKEMLQACKTLGDYSEYVHRVREYAKKMSIEEAVDRAIDECIGENILRKFLERNRAEARAMSIYEYDQEEHIRLEREEAFEDGRKEGIVFGENKKLRELVEKKVKKGLSVSQIAEMLEESVEKIEDIVKSIQNK